MTKSKKTQQKKSSTIQPAGSSIGRRLLWLLGGLVVLGGATLLALDVSEPLPSPPPELEAVQTFPEMDPVHLAPESPLPVYNSDPPTSGPHDPAPAPCGIYRAPVSDQAYLHSMEHGAVVIQYDPSLPEQDIVALESIVRSIGRETLLAPRANSPAPLSLTAWTNLLLVDDVDEEVIRGFEREFGNRNAPEPGAICAFQVDQGA